MANIFLDSFDHYSDLTDKYINAGLGANTVDLSGVHSRTGLGCCQLSSFMGPFLPFADRSAVGLVAGLAWFSPALTAYGTRQVVMRFVYLARGYYYGGQLEIFAQADGSVGVINPQANNVLGVSAPGFLLAPVYNYIEVKVLFSYSSSGYVQIRVNGAVALTLPAQQTLFAALPIVTGLILEGQGGGGSYIDDFYLNDLTGAVNNDFEGAVRVYHMMPRADSAPLQWTPSIAGPHYPMVNTVPIDPTKMVQDSTVGDEDAYLYDAGVITPTMQIKCVQHSVYARLDASGSGGVQSLVNGHLGPLYGLSTGGHLYMSQWDVNPATGLAWTPTDMGLIQAGPRVAL